MRDKIKTLVQQNYIKSRDLKKFCAKKSHAKLPYKIVHNTTLINNEALIKLACGVKKKDKDGIRHGDKFIKWMSKKTEQLLKNGEVRYNDTLDGALENSTAHSIRNMFKSREIRKNKK